MNVRHALLFILLISSGASGYAQDSIGAHKPNIIVVMPFQFTESGLGFGAGYERVIDKRGYFAVSIPVSAIFNVANSNRIYDYNTGVYKTGKADAMFYAMPDIKYYPTGCYGKLKYAVGVSFVVATGQTSVPFTNLGGLNVTEVVQSHFVMGGMLQNSLNIDLGKYVYASVEFGIGNSFTERAGGVQEDNKVLVQGAIKVGRRF